MDIVANCHLAWVVEAGMNSLSQTFGRSDGAVRHVYGTVEIIIAKSTLFKLIVKICLFL